jgi:hypothetical protein
MARQPALPLDYHSSPTVYVIVAVRDIDPDDGPLHFLGKAASRRVAQAVGYGRRGVPYRLTDEVVYQRVDPAELPVPVLVHGAGAQRLHGAVARAAGLSAAPRRLRAAAHGARRPALTNLPQKTDPV